MNLGPLGPFPFMDLFYLGIKYEFINKQIIIDE